MNGSWYQTTEDEAHATTRAAHRARCVVRSMGIGATPVGPRALGEVDCADGWAAARMLLAAAIEDSRTHAARAIAARLRAVYPDDDAFARAVQVFVASSARFQPEIGEVFQNGGYTLGAGYGDCDDHARAVIAIARAGGLPADLALLHHGDNPPPGAEGPTHAVGVLGPHRMFAETTVPALYGEHPNDAAIRLGLIDARQDLAREVVIMTDKDLSGVPSLPPIPAGFVERNPDVYPDALALTRLGYFGAQHDPDSACLRDYTADDEMFRRAVATFQLENGCVPDGLIGPQTRAAIGRLLSFRGMGEIAANYVAATAPTKVNLTKHLSTKFFQDVIAMAKRFQAKGSPLTAEDYLKVFLSESGIRANIKAWSGDRYGGLNGMGESNLPGLGFNGKLEDWMALSEEEQLPYVERFIAGQVANSLGGHWGELSTPDVLYSMNFVPAYVKNATKSGTIPADPETVLVAAPAGSPDPKASDAEWEAWRKAHHDFYSSNRGLDTEHDGTITIRNMGESLDRAVAKSKAYWAEVQARLAANGEGDGAVASIAGAGSSVAGVVVGGVMVVSAIAAAYAAWRFA